MDWVFHWLATARATTQDHPRWLNDRVRRVIEERRARVIRPLLPAPRSCLVDRHWYGPEAPRAPWSRVPVPILGEEEKKKKGTSHHAARAPPTRTTRPFGEPRGEAFRVGAKCCTTTTEWSRLLPIHQDHPRQANRCSFILCLPVVRAVVTRCVLLALVLGTGIVQSRGRTTCSSHHLVPRARCGARWFVVLSCLLSSSRGLTGEHRGRLWRVPPPVLMLGQARGG